MRSFPVVFMRGGTSKGLMFHKEDLPEDRAQWDNIFLQCMGNPDPKQIDGMGGTVSSNNKIVIVSKSEREGVDVDYLVGQVVVGKNQVDYKSNCGNMTSATAPFAIEEGMIENLTEPVTTVRMYNENTRKLINVDVPVKDGKFNNEGECRIAGIDGTAGELMVRFMNPAGSKTGKLLPTGNAMDTLNVEGVGEIDATILDVSNPMILLRAEDVGGDPTATPDQVNADKELSRKLEAVRAHVAAMLGFCDGPENAAADSPAIPKIGFFSAPCDYTALGGEAVSAADMDVCVRVISVFKCHKACPLTSAGAISVCAALPGSIMEKTLAGAVGLEEVRIGHPSGIMAMRPHFAPGDTLDVTDVAVQRTARRIMEGTIYIHD